MARLRCRCLNVVLHCKEEKWETRPVPGERVLAPGHRLTTLTLHEIEQDLHGLTAEHVVLLQSETVGDWTIQSCANCGCDVCVSHCQKNRTLVCPGLLSTDQDVAQVKGHLHYSSVFRIAVNPDLDSEEEEMGRGARPRASSMSFGRDDPLIRQLHTQVRQYLAREEEDMEERIREFERKEKDTFARLQHKTFTQRTLLFAAIDKARRGVAKEDGASQAHPSPNSSPFPSIDNQQKRVTITLSDPRPTSNNKPVADDALFSLDGFDEEVEEVDGGEKGGVAFPQSDDEESGTDDSSYRDLSSVQIASSAPLSVPLFHSQPQDMREAGVAGGPADMASSIKALALSVQNTGVFGDLPRPRVNSASRYK
jgi:hypothetical protein